VHPLLRHLFNGNDIGIGVEVLRRVDHLREAAPGVLNEDIRQQQGERFMADQLARAPHRVSQAERRLLAGEADGAGLWEVLRQQRELGLLPALYQG
jgi:hypothetical protein